MDIVQTALAHASAHDGIAYGLAAAAGLFTSIGPCVAPRYFAVASFTTRGARGVTGIAAFVMGTLLAYLCVAVAGSLVMRLVGASPFVYASAAAALILLGARAIVSSNDDCCENHENPIGAGAAFFLGVASSIVISPCCTPVLVAFGSLNSSMGTPLSLVGLVAMFTVGHLAPLGVAAVGGGVFVAALSRYRAAISTVNGAVLIALGAYYAVLA